MSDIQTEVPSSGGVMVCVTGQRSCERLINHGAKRKKDDQKLFIVHCVQTGHNFMNTTFEADAIEYLFTCALLVNAELTILRATALWMHWSILPLNTTFLLSFSGHLRRTAQTVLRTSLRSAFRMLSWMLCVLPAIDNRYTELKIIIS